ncbi:hypothetical protein [Solitalea koreensis]|uniref:Uncharacterized protein n=1 Tax=Solitalea koreensis TaxID=543615 RepID=A0A521BBN2_9SPHI|nr:hypothetical protein [Solitalea koreensis]SMO44492.1 hypothetical protein SAMN06265350_10271 [Solitalea koreensis]
MIGKLLTVFLLISTVMITPGEKYYVTFIKGNVLLERTKKQVKIGDRLNQEDKLVFGDKTAKVSCISPGKGRFDISAQTLKPDAQGELLAVLRSTLVPAAGTYHLSTRSLSDQNDDPENYFKIGDNDHFLILENEMIPIDPKYLIGGVNFFFVQYTVNGKTILKKVSSQGNSITFNKNLFIDEKGKALDPDKYVNTLLCFQESVNGSSKSKIIAKFTPVVVSKEELLAEISVLKTNLINLKNVPAVKNEIYAHLTANYGTVNISLFESLVN